MANKLSVLFLSSHDRALRSVESHGKILSPVHTVAEKCDSRRISPLSRRFRRQSHFCETVSLFCDIVDRTLINYHSKHHTHTSFVVSSGGDVVSFSPFLRRRQKMMPPKMAINMTMTRRMTSPPDRPIMDTLAADGCASATVNVSKLLGLQIIHQPNVLVAKVKHSPPDNCPPPGQVPSPE